MSTAPTELGAAALAALADERITAAERALPQRAAGLTVAEFLASEPRLEEFWTPLFALDGAAIARNAAVIQGWATERGFELMPHGKTTMAPALWQRQLAAGASGLTFATMGQVRTARSFGAARIMLANAAIDARPLRWLAGELADEGFAFLAWADGPGTVEAMERALDGVALPRPVDVAVDLGAPGGRTGVRDPEAGLELARRIAASPVLRLAGTAGYEGSLGHDRSPAALDAVRGYLDALVRLHEGVAGIAERAGDDPAGLVLTAGGSAYLDLVAAALEPLAARARVVVRSGASLLHDDGFYHGISPLDDALAPAMRGYARVVSHPEPGLALLDGGKRDFPYDEGLPVPFAVAAELGADERPLDAAVTALNDQHAYLRAPGGAALDVREGEVVRLGLSHPCTAFDKWRFIPVVEHARSTRVVELVRTFF